jgi:UDP-glucuronate 4-epimerase
MALFKFVSAMRKGNPIDIYGEGKMRRDFTYIDDLVEAVIKLVFIPPSEHNRVTAAPDTLSSQAPFRVVNIGGGQPLELLDFVVAIENALGETAVRNLLPMQKGDVPQTFAAPDLLRELTGYVPNTEAAEGVRQFVEWYKSYYDEKNSAVR